MVFTLGGYFLSNAHYLRVMFNNNFTGYKNRPSFVTRLVLFTLINIVINEQNFHYSMALIVFFINPVVH